MVNGAFSHWQSRRSIVYGTTGLFIFMVIICCGCGATSMELPWSSNIWVMVCLNSGASGWKNSISWPTVMWLRCWIVAIWVCWSYFRTRPTKSDVCSYDVVL